LNDQNQFLNQYERINFLDKSIFNIKRIQSPTNWKNALEAVGEEKRRINRETNKSKL